MTPNIALAFAAGLLSVLSPCVLPLVPSYISYVGGVSLKDMKEGNDRQWSVVFRTLFFILGFTIVFVVLGVAFSGSVVLFSGASVIVNVIAGAIVIVLGLNMIFDFWAFLNMEKRFQFSEKPRGYVGSTMIGMAFGAGWTPCIGPILAAILFLAGTTGNVATGVLYLTVYSIGLGLPFLLVSLFFERAVNQLRRLQKHLGTIKIVSGVFLIVIGILIAFGRFQDLAAAFARAGNSLRTWDQTNPQLSRILISSAALLIGILPWIRPVLDRLRAVDAETRKAFLSVPRMVISSLFVIPALLGYAGVINLAEVMVFWLRFEGI